MSECGCEGLLQVKVEQRKEDPHQKVVCRIKELQLYTDRYRRY